MGLKEKIENNLVIWLLGTLLTGFLGGIGTYKALLEIAHLDVVAEKSYVRKDELEARYVNKSVYDAIKVENTQLKEALRRQAESNQAVLLTSLSALITDAKNIKRMSGEELVSSFNGWIQKGMQITKMVGEETHRLFNNNVYFSGLRTKNPSQTAIERDIQKRLNQGVATLEGAMMILGSSAQ